MKFSFPVLAADIGGTNARFSVIGADGTQTMLSKVRNRDFPTPQAAVTELLGSWKGERPVSAVFALACPIHGETFRLTNADWELVPRIFLEETGLKQLVVMNDFVAQGLAAITLDAGMLLPIGGGAANPDAPRVIVGPGTGLGVALAVQAAGVWTIIAGEGGHVDLGPIGDRQTQIWPFINQPHGRVEAETVICGAGLENIYQAIVRADGGSPEPRSAESISAAAIAGTDKACIEALEIMVQLLARVAGDLAITTMSRGGVYLAGGIVRHILPVLTAPGFRRAFEDKPPFRQIMAQIPMFAMQAEEPAISGIAGLVSGSQKLSLGEAIRIFE